MIGKVNRLCQWPSDVQIKIYIGTKGQLYFGDKLNEVKVKRWLKDDGGYIGTILPKSLRVDAMKFLFGKGPLDFLWGGDPGDTSFWPRD